MGQTVTRAPNVAGQAFDQLPPIIRKLMEITMGRPDDPSTLIAPPLTTIGPGAIPLSDTGRYFRKILGETFEDLGTHATQRGQTPPGYGQTIVDAAKARQAGSEIHGTALDNVNLAADFPGAARESYSLPNGFDGGNSFEHNSSMIDVLADLFAKAGVGMGRRRIDW